MLRYGKKASNRARCSKKTPESKTSVKVTLNTIISAGKEHARHMEPDPQLVNSDASEAIYTMSFMFSREQGLFERTNHEALGCL